MITIPMLGELDEDDDDWLRSQPVVVGVLGGAEFEFILEGYENDEAKDDFHQAIRNFLTLDSAALTQEQGALFDYYQDCIAHLAPGEDPLELIDAASIWQHVRFGYEILVTRRPHGDKQVYISLGGGCDWECEHGLQLVFKQGRLINKLGPYDGHLSNADAYDDDKLEHVVYRRFRA